METSQTGWGVEPLWRVLRPRLPGLSVEVVSRIGSTNTALLERARARRTTETTTPFGRRVSDFQPCLLVAEHQTAGRGRLGRSWHAVRGASLTFSLSLPLAREDWSGLSLAVGVAIAEALEPSPGATPRVGLKWPNDLWLMDTPDAGRKLGGILVEAVSSGPTRLAVIGVGLNIAPIDADAANAETACVQELQGAATPPSVLATVAPALVDAVLAFDDAGFAAFAERYARRDVLRGRPVRTNEGGAAEGIAEGVADDGALLLRTAAGVVAVRSGEVNVRPEPPAGTPAMETAC